jgi:hypothetical protein
MLNLHGNALVDLAEVSALAGGIEDSRVKLEHALALYTQKGNRIAAERARRRLELLNTDATVQ